MKNKIQLFSGLSLFLCFCLLIGGGFLVSGISDNSWVVLAAELLAFGLPALLFMLTNRENVSFSRFRIKRLPKGTFSLTVFCAMAVSVGSLFLGLIAYQLFGIRQTEFSASIIAQSSTGLSLLQSVLVIVVVSSVMEEVFLHGFLFSAQEKAVGTATAIIFVGFAFAMLHGNSLNFIGPLLAGVIYGYLTYILDSVYPAILAHAINNVYYMLILWLTRTYAAFGIWNYFTFLNLLLFLLFSYIALRSLEKMFERDAVKHFEKKQGWRDALTICRNPAIWAFFIAFIAKTFLIH